jgi:3-oxoacyl-[acyl-carrier protein] reductase
MIARQFIARGDFVWGIARGDPAIDSPDYLHLNADVGDAIAVWEAFAEIPTLDILVNNAGIGPVGYALTTDPAEMERTIRTNMLGAMYVSREAVRKMRKTGGRIVNIGSIHMALEPIGASVYTASKTGMAAFAHVLAKEVAPYGITVNTLGMASIETDMLAEVPSAKVAEFIAGLPIPRLSTIEDVMNVIDWFVARESSFITAQTVYLGGIHG